MAAHLRRKMRLVRKFVPDHTFSAPGAHKDMPAATAEPPKRLFTANYILILATNFLLYFVDYAMMLWTTAWAIRHFKADVSDAGLASGLFIVGALIARIPMGRFIDFIGRRRTFVLGAAIYLVTSPLYLLCPNVWVLCLLRLAHGFGFGTTSTAASTVVASIIPLSRMGTGIGYFTLGLTFASAAGPFVAMNLDSQGLYEAVVWISTATAALVLIASLAIKCPERAILPSEKEKLFKVRAGDFFERRAVPISTIALLGGICYSSVLSYIGAYASFRGVTGIGATCFFVVFAAMTVLSRPFAGWLIDHRGGNVTIVPALLCVALSMCVMAAAASDVMFLLGAALLGYGYGTITAGCHALAVHISPLHRIGVGTSTYFVFLDGGVGVGPYFLGLFVDHLGFQSIYIISAVIALLAIAFFYWALLRRGLFSRSHMQRTAKAKMLRQQRRNRGLKAAAEQGAQEC